MKYLALCFFVLLMLASFGAEFGEYKYSKYMAVQQQLNNQRRNAFRRQRMYNQSPTRNIRYPSAGNPYPNIQRDYSIPVGANRRYSPAYYRAYY